MYHDKKGNVWCVCLRPTCLGVRTHLIRGRLSAASSKVASPELFYHGWQGIKGNGFVV